MKNITQQGLYSHWQKILAHQQNDFRSIAITELITKYLDASIPLADLGCGTGIQSVFLNKKGFNVTGFDISNEMLSMAISYAKLNRIKKLKFFNKSLKQLSEGKKQFKQAICLDVLEHIKDDEKAIKEIYSLMINGSKLVLSVPAHQHLYGQKDKAIGHYRRYSYDEIKIKTENAGFTIEKIFYWNFIGYLAVSLNKRISKGSISESFRQSNSFSDKLKQLILKRWFTLIENTISMPNGLSIIVLANK